MPNSSPKFATKHKFSGPKKKRKFFNFQKRRGSPSEVIDDSLLPEPSATEDSAEDCGIGLAGGSGSDSGRVRQTFRHDTVMLEPADLLKIEKDAEEKLRNLASTPATKRKSELLVRAADAAAASDAAAEGSDVMNTRFAVVSLDAINALLSFFKCKVCGGDASMSKGERDYGLAIKMVVSCEICGDSVSVWSSPRANSGTTCNPFVVNILAARAMKSTGNQQTALNYIFAIMNVSTRGTHTKTWQAHLKSKLTGPLRLQLSINACPRAHSSLFAICTAN